jgi:hypothetical protein
MVAPFAATAAKYAIERIAWSEGRHIGFDTSAPAYSSRELKPRMLHMLCGVYTHRIEQVEG